MAPGQALARDWPARGGVRAGALLRAARGGGRASRASRALAAAAPRALVRERARRVAGAGLHDRAQPRRAGAGRRVPAEAVSHDWWAYLVLSALGEIVYDPEPAILFRKHKGQAFGIGVGTIDAWRAKLTRGTSVLPQARAFARLYRDRLDPERRRVLDRFLAAQTRPGARPRYAARPDVYRQSRRDDALLRAKLALGRI